MWSLRMDGWQLSPMAWLGLIAALLGPGTAWGGSVAAAAVAATLAGRGRRAEALLVATVTLAVLLMVLLLVAPETTVGGRLPVPGRR